MSEMRTRRARALRQKETLAEARLWTALRGRRLGDLKFRRQHTIERFYADFACESARIAIEVDGGIHRTDEGRLNDLVRQEEIEALGWSVLRFTNEQVIGDLPAVLAAIRAQAELAGAVTPHPPARDASGPLPLPTGEG